VAGLSERLHGDAEARLQDTETFGKSGPSIASSNPGEQIVLHAT
jgi:hypothetical protein